MIIDEERAVKITSMSFSQLGVFGYSQADSCYQQIDSLPKTPAKAFSTPPSMAEERT